MNDNGDGPPELIDKYEVSSFFVPPLLPQVIE